MLPKFRAPSHPGEILQEDFLVPMEISQSQFAKHLKCKPGKINEIVNGKRGITPEMALYLSDALGTTPQFWINLQANFDLWHAKQDHDSVKRIA
jgi:addiction module HigA family antidote